MYCFFRMSSSGLHPGTVLKSFVVLWKKCSTVYQCAAGELAFYWYCFVKLVQSKIPWWAIGVASAFCQNTSWSCLVVLDTGFLKPSAINRLKEYIKTKHINWGAKQRNGTVKTCSPSLKTANLVYRCVPDKQRSFALGVQSVFLRLLGMTFLLKHLPLNNLLIWCFSRLKNNALRSFQRSLKQPVIGL